MCLLLKGDNPVTAYEALRVLHRATTIFMLTVEVALADYLRPDISFTPGVPVEVAPRPLEGPPRHHPSRIPFGGRDEKGCKPSHSGRRGEHTDGMRSTRRRPCKRWFGVSATVVINGSFC
ncbi:hypothetical protein SAMN04488074_13418 [Lentzea albidocapillata subsp. violacea]|uniref:Uncharacterized protein n=1 Tax=Lentzea albidocapillata subsp. violacea TaxID=128104 RepID=A0A1G9YM80_9PSEU|nr:hypothetical protein SAMN04488074_13418 [Lentzea albidocapillata subsp. violacea]